MKIIIFILMYLISTNSIAQTIAYISVQNIKNTPIPYAHVYSATNEIGFLSNELGQCKIIIPKPDSILISAIGYEKAVVYVTDGKYNIKLKELNYGIDTVIVFPKDGKELKIGVTEKSSKKVGLCSSNTIGYSAMLQLSHNGELARLKEVKFYVQKKERRAIRKVRLRVFSSIEEKPFQEVLMNSIIIEVKKKGWNTIDLTNYDVYVPASFFIGVEFIENEYYSDFCLGLSDKYSKENKTWVKRVGSYWLQLNFLKTEEKQLNLMVNATLEIF